MVKKNHLRYVIGMIPPTYWGVAFCVLSSPPPWPRHGFQLGCRERSRRWANNGFSRRFLTLVFSFLLCGWRAPNLFLSWRFSNVHLQKTWFSDKTLEIIWLALRSCQLFETNLVISWKRGSVFPLNAGAPNFIDETDSPNSCFSFSHAIPISTYQCFENSHPTTKKTVN